MFPYGQTVTVYRPGGMSWNGDLLPATTHEIKGCAVWQNSSMELQQGRDTVITARTMVVPNGSDILATDLVYLPGQDTAKPPRWQVTGDPNPVQSPFTGWRPGVEVQLKIVEG